MRSIEMPLQLSKKINDVLRFRMIGLSILASTLRVTWFSCMTKPKNYWGQASSTPCGTVLISCDILEKGAYELEYYEGNMLDEPKNGLYLKRYYA
jgi:hypothetical protein